jgi:hypothetical protein
VASPAADAAGGFARNIGSRTVIDGVRVRGYLGPTYADRPNGAVGERVDRDESEAADPIWWRKALMELHRYHGRMPGVAVVQGRHCGRDKIFATPARNLIVVVVTDDPVLALCCWSDEPSVDHPIAA